MVIQRKYSGISGVELRAERKAAGMNQTVLASLAGIGRGAVSYWENKAEVDARGWAPKRMFEVLGLTVLKYYSTNTRARGDGVLHDSQQEWLARHSAQLKVRVLEQAAQFRQPCGATTRKRRPCRLMSEPGRRRCKFHGGLSTGPKTDEGKARIAGAQRTRWEDWRRQG